jgi:NADPH:quinone reductase-like Zn-dependent oxidoreductase
MCLDRSGGDAEYVTNDARRTLLIPNGLDFVHAAGLAEPTFFEDGRWSAGRLC